jgi:hypothetical protein
VTDFAITTLEHDIEYIDALDGVASAIEIDDYPDLSRGPGVLALQFDTFARPVSMLRGLP